ncbi:hypothetical protein Tco_0574995 [Tanacetum coccineum]
MSNTNNILQTQTSNALHNAIMEAGGKDRPPMLAPSNYVLWKSRIKRYIDIKPSNELIHYCLQNPPYKFKWAERKIPVVEGSLKSTTKRYIENYKNISQEIRNQLDAEAEVVQVILIRIDNDIYSTVDACPNACEMWKAIERLKQGESINVQDLETNLYWKFRKSTSLNGESLESYYSRMAKNEVNEIRSKRLARTTNPLVLVARQQPVYHPQNHPTHHTQNSSIRTPQTANRNKGKAIVNSPPPTYDQEPEMVAEDDALSKEKGIDKLMALISPSFKKIHKPTNNNLRISSNTSRENHDNTLRINKGTGYDNQREINVVRAGENVAYHKEKMLLCKQEEAGFQMKVEQADWRDETDDEPEDQDFEAHNLYMAHIQEVTPDAANNSEPIFDAEPLQKVQNDDDNYNVFASDREHPEQPESVNDTYLNEQTKRPLDSSSDVSLTTWQFFSLCFCGWKCLVVRLSFSSINSVVDEVTRPMGEKMNRAI